MTRARVVRRRYAGRAGDGEFAVLSTVRSGEVRHIHRLTPCPSCPWRRDAPLGAFPAEAYRISASTAYDMAGSTFACHESGSDNPATCASFLLRNADHNLAVRLAAMRGDIRFDLLDDAGIELFDNYRAMAEANGVDPDDEVLRPCRANGYGL